MTKPAKAERTQELHVDVDAPVEAVWKALTEAEGIASWFAPIAKVSKPGLGGEVTIGWSEEMMGSAQVDVWEPNRRVRWIHEGMMGPGTALAMEFELEPSAGGKTRVRLVQSGFGEFEGWDGFFEGTDTGWKYFLYNLGFYVEKHAGRRRQMISERIEVHAPRAAVWKHIAAQLIGVSDDRASAIQAGDPVRVALPASSSTPGIVVLAVHERGLALRLPDLDDSLLFIELEGSSKPSFHVGWWLSVYDAARAAELEAPARQAFRRILESLAEATPPINA